MSSASAASCCCFFLSEQGISVIATHGVMRENFVDFVSMGEAYSGGEVVRNFCFWGNYLVYNV
jgi:hypothetical protein